MPERWLSEPYLRALIGPQATESLMAAMGGETVYVPHRPKSDHPLAGHIGMHAFAALCQACKGEYVALPSSRLGERHHLIRDLLARGCSQRSIARQLKITERYVRKVAGTEAADQPAAPSRQLSLL